MKRKTPVRHKVRSHKRQGRRVKSYQRGKGQKPQRSRRYGAVGNLRSIGKISTELGVMTRRIIGKKTKVAVYKLSRSGKSIGEAEVYLDRESLTDVGYGSAYINTIQINDSERGRGYGGVLLRDVEESLSQMGMKRVYVHSTPPAVGFWRGHGYLEYFFEPHQNSYKLVKVI